MTIVEHAPDQGKVLDFVNDQIRALQQAGAEPAFVVTGKKSYPLLCRAVSVQNQRGKGQFDTYNFIPIVLDPFRDDAVCVLPRAAECAKGVDAHRLSASA